MLLQSRDILQKLKNDGLVKIPIYNDVDRDFYESIKNT